MGVQSALFKYLLEAVRPHCIILISITWLKKVSSSFRIVNSIDGNFLWNFHTEIDVFVIQEVESFLLLL